MYLRSSTKTGFEFFTEVLFSQSLCTISNLTSLLDIVHLMKRAFDSTGDLGSEDPVPSSAPKMRRAFSDGDSNTIANSASNSSSSSSSASGGLGATLQDKNRFMSLDILKKRREIHRLRSDLLAATATSRLKEADVAATQALLSEVRSYVLT
jgi:hypothetical protein